MVEFNDGFGRCLDVVCDEIRVKNTAGNLTGAMLTLPDHDDPQQQGQDTEPLEEASLA